MAVSSEDAQFEALVEFMRRDHNFDLGGYKRSTLKRRTGKRIQALGLSSYGEYRAHLEQHPDEYENFLDTLLINVSRFFRDPEAWECLQEKVICQLVPRAREDGLLRVWSAGCSHGQEAYTTAMVLFQALGAEDYRRAVKIYATDVDEEALVVARNGVYTEKEIESVPRPHREACFEQADHGVQIKNDIRRSIVFGRHDLSTDAPISRLDLLVCRNTLMYFNAESQARIAARLHFGLRDDGYLFLGKAETVVSQSRLFAPVDLKYRIFRNLPRSNGRLGTIPSPLELGLLETLRNAAFETSPVAQVVLDGVQRVLAVNHKARTLLGLTGNEVGVPLKDLALSYRPVELRSKIEQARAENRAVQVTQVEHETRGTPITLNVDVVPQLGPNGVLVGFIVSFHDVTGVRVLEQERERARHELEDAYEELQSTSEEMETTNEELQSTVEELETTNEELQSTNEEMETMNEELQSSNEELQTANAELRERTSELHRVNSFLESILTSVRTGMVVLDRAMAVMVWNRESEETWGVKREEAFGKRLGDLDIGLPADELEPALEAAVTRGQRREVEVQAVNRRGKTILCRVEVLPLMGVLGESQGVLLLIRIENERGA
ncbi:MAG TPA: CheR family methyltransferase [Candidatus Polarisedimenticolaceae bacterium]|nr:CheR family methyltransferase [Candidatus Polarisedimenticolaceae bacterium]